mgnify:CR=1 FL=1
MQAAGAADFIIRACTNSITAITPCTQRATRASVRGITSSVAGEDMVDESGKIRVLRRIASEKPAEQLLILARHQAPVAFPVCVRQLRKDPIDKRREDQVELEHAAPARPAHPTVFIFTYHRRKVCPAP